MAKGKSKGRNNSGGGGTATIIGTNNADTINFINKQVKDLGITGNIEVEFRQPKKSERNAGGFVSHSSDIEKQGDIYFAKPIYKVTVLGHKSLTTDNIIAHELTHIKQMQDGRLKWGYKERREDYFGQTRIIRYEKGFYWEGKLHTTDNQYESIMSARKRAKTQEAYQKAHERYMALPWEKEAYAAGEKYD